VLQKVGVIKFFEMKKTWNGEFLQGLEELAEKDECTISGGESLWFWIGYGVGRVSNLFTGS
jgi:hypothetical protein